MADASGVHPLYRGFPMPLPNRVEDARQAAIDSSDLITATMKESGAFLYYYDAVRDSVDDHIHPNPRYYNILRHNGGIITLLRAFEATRHVKYLAPARRAIDFLLERSKYEEENPDRLYVFYNKKAKLGGTGTALVALMLYYHLTGDDRYIEPAAAMARHLIGRIAGDGEFIGYYIHPGHQDGAPLVDVTAEDRRPLFSFYYPGEALLGMALFDLQAPGHEKLKQELRSNGRRALDFLMDERPKRYPELFLTLPADSWLMQAIEAWWDREEMQDERYRAFVFSDGHQMLDHMYTQDNAPYPDYPGSFYYHYGDHTLPDGSRVEGLVAALHLAKKTGDDKLYKEFDEACRMAIRTLLQTHNSEAACYFMRDRTRALGGFRFKYTRHWNRVDSTQHAACAIYRWLLAEQA